MIIQALTCGSLLLLSILLAANPLKINTIANRWLSIFIFCVFSNLADVVFFKSGTYITYPHLQGLSEIFLFAMVPSLYLSVVYFTSPKHKFKTIGLLHFLPCAIFFLYQLPYFLSSAETKRFMHAHPMPIAVIDNYRIIILTLAIRLQFLIYWVLSFFRIRRHQKNIKLLVSELSPIKLDWLNYLLFFLLGMYLLWLNTTYFHLGFTEKITVPVYLMASFFIAYYVLKQKEVFEYSTTVLEDLDDIFEINKNSNSVRLEVEQVEFLKTRIQDFMNKTEIYLEPGLSLPALARATGFSVHDLSFVLNRGFSQNFYQFVNLYRLEKAKILLRSEVHQQLTIAGIAIACGFNSKTVFNTAFKKLTGMTPSEYKNSGIN